MSRHRDDSKESVAFIFRFKEPKDLNCQNHHHHNENSHFLLIFHVKCCFFFISVNQGLFVCINVLLVSYTERNCLMWNRSMVPGGFYLFTIYSF